MTTFDPTDPAAEIKYLKALEKGKGWPQEYPDPAKVKKGKDWPAAVDPAKVKVPRMWRPTAAAAPAAAPMGGMSVSELVRAVLLIAAAIGAALIID